jgi:hypothetical protein
MALAKQDTDKSKAKKNTSNASASRNNAQILSQRLSEARQKTQQQKQQIQNRADSRNTQYQSSVRYDEQPSVTFKSNSQSNSSGNQWEQQMRRAETQNRPSVTAKLNWNPFPAKTQADIDNQNRFNELSRRNASVRYDEGNATNGLTPNVNWADQLYNRQMQIADKPQKTLQDAVDLYRIGAAQQNIVDNNKALKNISDANRLLIAGAENTLNGLANIPGFLMASAGGATGNEQLASAGQNWMNELNNSDIQAALQNNNNLNETFAGKVAQGVGGMIPSMVMAPFGQGAALATMLGGVYGSSGSQAMKSLGADGLDWGDIARAQGYAAANAAVEGLTEAINPGMPGFLPFSAKNMLGEAFEEMVSEAVDPMLQPLIDPSFGQSGDVNQEYSDYLYNNTLFGAFGAVLGDEAGMAAVAKHGKEILEAGAIGAATSAILSVPTTIEVGKTVDQVKKTTDILNLENDYIDTLRNDYAKNINENGADANQTLDAKAEYVSELSKKYVELKQYDPVQLKESDIEQVKQFGEFIESQMTSAIEECRDNGIDMTKLDQIAELSRQEAFDQIDAQKPEIRGEVASTLENPRYSLADKMFDIPEIYATEIRKDLRDTPEPIARNGRPIVTPANVINDFNNSELAASIRNRITEMTGDTSEAGTDFAESLADDVRRAVGETFGTAENVRENVENEAPEDILEGTAEDLMHGEDHDTSKTRTDRYENQTEADEAYLDRTDSRDYDVVHDADLTAAGRRAYDEYGYDATYERINNTEATRDVMRATLELQLASNFIQESKTRLQNELASREYTMDIDGTVRDNEGNALGNVYSDENIEAIQDLQNLKRREMEIQKKSIEISSKAGLFLRSLQTLYTADPVLRCDHLDKEIADLNKEQTERFKKQADKHRKVTVDPLSDAERTALSVGFSDQKTMRQFIVQETGGRWNEKKINQYLETYFNENTSAQQRSWLAQDVVEQRIANQIPASRMEKLNAWRYLMMLGNPVTHFRNITGNALMQFMTAGKDLNRYFVESWIQRNSYENSLDPTSAEDNRLLRYSLDNMNEVLHRDYNAIQGMSSVQKHRYLVEHGYTGEVLKSMEQAKGTWESNLNPTTAQRWSERLAHELKQRGVRVERGQLVTDSGDFADFDQLAKDTYNESRRNFIKQTDMHVRSAEGRRSRAGIWGVFRNSADSAYYNLAEQYELDNNVLGSEEAKYSINSDERGSLKQRVNRKRHYFNDRSRAGRVTNALIDFNTRMMGEKEDTQWFTRPRYQASFVKELKTQGYTVEDGHLVKDGTTLTEAQQRNVLNGISQKALDEAEQSTYHDASQVANFLSRGRKIKGLGFFLDAVLPFTTTPINIGKRIIEYSPVGLLNSLTFNVNRLRSGKINANQFMDSIAKGMTGTEAAALGAWLFSMGLITPKDDSDPTEKSYKKGLGISEYALKIGDHYYSLEQFAPTATSVLFGAQLFDTLDKANYKNLSGSQYATELLGDALNLMNPAMDMSMVSSLNDLLENSDDVASLAQSALTSYLGQFTPTVGARVNAIISENKKSTYSRDIIQNLINQNINKMPFAPLLLEMYDGSNTRQWVRNTLGLEGEGQELRLPNAIDRQGDEVKNVGIFDDSDNPYIRALGRGIYNMFSPGNLTHDTTTDYDRELMRLYETTGNDVLPKTTTLRDLNGNYYDMTPSEQEKYNKMYYGNYRKDAIDFMDSDVWKQLDEMPNQREADAIKSKILFELQRHESNMVSDDYFSKVDPEKYSLYDSDIAVEALEELGMPAWQYYWIKNQDYDKDKDGENIMNSKQMRVRQALEAAGVYDTLIDAYKDGKISLGDIGLNSYVAKWTDEQFTYNLNKLDAGDYDPSSGAPGVDQRTRFAEGVEKNEKALDNAEKVGLDPEQFYSLQDVKSDYGEDGKAISYSQDMNARQAAVENGSWDIIQQAIENGEITYKKASEITGIGTTVLKWDNQKFETYYGYLQDGTWTNDTAKDIMKTGKTSGRTSTGGSTRSSRRTSGSRRRSSGGSRTASVSSGDGVKTAEQAANDYMKFLAKAMGGSSSGSRSSNGIKTSINDSQIMSLYNQIMDRGNNYSTAQKIVKNQKV